MRYLAMQGSDLSAQQRDAARFGQIAVHASFGDVELAQMTLRGKQSINSSHKDFHLQKPHLHDPPQMWGLEGQTDSGCTS